VRFAVLSVLAACSFQARALPTGRSDAPSGSSDAPGDAKMIDARAKDAPPDACVDADHDGICDDVDDFLCGDPTPPQATVEMSGNNGDTDIVLTSIKANNAQMLNVAPGASIAVAFSYRISDDACSQACRDQIEIGWVPGGRVGCVFDAVVSPNSDTVGNAAKTLTAPTQPGAYDIRTNIGQNNSCGTTTSWWASSPGDGRTIARVCVH